MWISYESTQHPIPEALHPRDIHIGDTSRWVDGFGSSVFGINYLSHGNDFTSACT